MDPPCFTRGIKQAKAKKAKEKKREERRKRKKQKKSKKKKKRTRKKKDNNEEDEEEEEEEEAAGVKEGEEVDPLLVNTTTQSTGQAEVTVELEREMEEMMNRSEFTTMEADLKQLEEEEEEAAPEEDPLLSHTERREIGRAHV